MITGPKGREFDPRKRIKRLRGKLQSAQRPRKRQRLRSKIRSIRGRAREVDPGFGRYKKMGLPNPYQDQPEMSDPLTTVEEETVTPAVEPEVEVVPYTDEQMQALFPSIMAFEPSAYEGSPLYQFQLKEGQEALDRLMAARGLIGSGAERETHADFIGELGAQEANRMMGVAQREADRYYQMLQDQAESERLGSNETFNRQLALLELMLGQSPLSVGAQAAGGLADTNLTGAAQIYSILQNLVPNLTAGIPQYAGGGSAPPFIPPYPEEPDYGAAEQVEALS